MSITSEWTKGKIGDTCIVGDGAHAKVKRQISGVVYLTSKNLKDGRLDISQVSYISETDFNKHFRDESKALTKIKPNDVILGIIGTIGEPYLVNSRDRFGISSSVAILRPKESVLFPKYLFYWIENRIFQDALYAIKGGVAQGYVSLEMIRSLPLYYPQLSIQNKIASILANYDDLIENNTRRIEILELMAKLIYEEWFVNFRFPGHENVKMVPSELGEIPEGWKVKTLGELGKIITGKTPSTKNEENFGDHIYFIKTPDLHGNVFCVASSQCLSKVGEASQKNKTLPENTLLISCIGTVGVVSITSTKSQTNQQINALIPFNPAKLEYLFFELKKLKTHLENLGANGVTLTNVNKEKFQSIKVIDPGNNIIKSFHEIGSPMFSQIKNLQFKNQILRKTRDLLLPKLISGEIDVSDLNIRIRNENQES